jgi:DNA-binding MarR family transcriptional regulator
MVHKLEDNLGFLLGRTHRAMRRWLMSQLDPLGITYEQFIVLGHLWNKADISQSELVERTFMDKTSLARMLRRMEDADLVCREPDETDSRVNRVNLAARGRELEAKVTPLRQKGLSQATEGLSSEEVRDLKRILNHIFQNMSPGEE